jgi:hypothetical protein
MNPKRTSVVCEFPALKGAPYAASDLIVKEGDKLVLVDFKQAFRDYPERFVFFVQSIIDKLGESASELRLHRQGRAIKVEPYPMILEYLWQTHEKPGVRLYLRKRAESFKDPTGLVNSWKRGFSRTDIQTQEDLKRAFTWIEEITSAFRRSEGK